MVRTCMNTFKVTSIAYTGTDPKDSFLLLDQPLVHMCCTIDLFHITWTHCIIKTVPVMVGKLICENIADELIEPSLLHGKELLDDDIASLKGFSTFKKSGRPREDCSQRIHPTYRCNVTNDITCISRD